MSKAKFSLINQHIDKLISETRSIEDIITSLEFRSSRILTIKDPVRKSKLLEEVLRDIIDEIRRYSDRVSYHCEKIKSITNKELGIEEGGEVEYKRASEIKKKTLDEYS